MYIQLVCSMKILSNLPSAKYKSLKNYHMYGNYVEIVMNNLWL